MFSTGKVKKKKPVLNGKGGSIFGSSAFISGLIKRQMSVNAKVLMTLCPTSHSHPVWLNGPWSCLLSVLRYESRQARPLDACLTPALQVRLRPVRHTQQGFRGKSSGAFRHYSFLLMNKSSWADNGGLGK